MTTKKTFKVYILEHHKLFAEESGPYYQRNVTNGYFLRQTQIEEDTEEKCLEEALKDNELEYTQFVILPVNTFHNHP